MHNYVEWCWQLTEMKQLLFNHYSSTADPHINTNSQKPYTKDKESQRQRKQETKWNTTMLSDINAEKESATTTAEANWQHSIQVSKTPFEIVFTVMQEMSVLIYCCEVWREGEVRLHNNATYPPNHTAQALSTITTFALYQNLEKCNSLFLLHLLLLNYISEGSVSHINGVWPSFLTIWVRAMAHSIVFLHHRSLESEQMPQRNHHCSRSLQLR